MQHLVAGIRKACDAQKFQITYLKTAVNAYVYYL